MPENNMNEQSEDNSKWVVESEELIEKQRDIVKRALNDKKNMKEIKKQFYFNFFATSLFFDRDSRIDMLGKLKGILSEYKNSNSVDKMDARTIEHTYQALKIFYENWDGKFTIGTMKDYIKFTHKEIKNLEQYRLSMTPAVVDKKELNHVMALLEINDDYKNEMARYQTN